MEISKNEKLIFLGICLALVFLVIKELPLEFFDKYS